MDKFDNLKSTPLPFYSVPQLLQNALGKELDKDPEKIAKDVKETHKKVAEERFKTMQQKKEVPFTLKRADGRPPEVIKAAGGFFGRELAPVTIEHAREMLTDWQNLKPGEKNAWVQGWKVQTKGKHEHVPYVATGKESQKGGYNYLIKVPLYFEKGGRKLDPKIGADKWPLEEATILAVWMRGDEVIFLTGIPWVYITPPRPTSKPPRPRSKPPSKLRY
ncbi:hypothetical protein ACFLYR_07780 [Chloroflexota bacterium]